MSSSQTSASSGAAASAAAAAEQARMQEIILQQNSTEKTLKYYAAAMLGIVLLFTLSHWTRCLYCRFASEHLRRSKLMRVQVSTTRAVRHILLHQLPGVPSVGHAMVVLAYLVINIVLIVTNVDWSPDLLGIAKRLGSMAVVNALFITFLALKNTPLAVLTAYSYERLNILHQIGGYTTVLTALLHMILMVYSWIVKKKRVSMLTEGAQINGMIAMAAMFVMLVFALFIRRGRYEVFYISHILGYIVFLITIGMHRPDLQTKTLIMTAIAAGIWGSDRIVRGLRILWYSYDNQATIIPLPLGATRIVMRRSPSRAVSGSHCFIWIPRIRAIETHPFTIVQKTPNSIELVISRHDGFTNALYEYALKHPGTSLRASFDGPYGSLPNFAKIADKVILVAGGTGASFTFGVALNMLKNLKENDMTTIDFIWTVREEETVSWFQNELIELRASTRVNVILHTTRPSQIQSQTPPSPRSKTSTVEDEKRLTTLHSAAHTHHTTLGSDTSSEDLEKNPNIQSPTWESTSSLAATPGRPDVEKLIKDVVFKAAPEERIVIAGCGPETLMGTVRRTAAQCITVNGPSVELHSEQFGW